MNEEIKFIYELNKYRQIDINKYVNKYMNEYINKKYIDI